MKQLRDYQIELSKNGSVILQKYKMLYLALEVRTGKTAIALEVAKLNEFKNVLFLTKKKAITSILNDYKDFGYLFNITVINNESLHTITDNNFDLIIMDEAHRFGAFPKPSKGAKDFKLRFANKHIIYLSGTPTPESYSQIYHQLWVSNNSPFKQWMNFYKWSNDFVTKKIKYLGTLTVNDYSYAKQEQIDKFIKPITLTYTQQEAGFTTSVTENIIYVEMKESTYNLIKTLKNNKVIQGKNEVILADTKVKEMQKVHQLFSGTIKFESGNSMIIDSTKAEVIQQKFKGIKIGIFYKFKEELNLLKNIFTDTLTTDLDEFNTTDKNIALQILSGREGISLKNAKYLVYYNIDFSATSYWQSRDRLTTMERTSNDVFYIFATNGIEKNIYNSVINKKDYTLSHYKKDDRTAISN